MVLKYRIWSSKYKLFTHDPRWPSNQHAHDEYLVTPRGEVWTLVTTDHENYFRYITDEKFVIQRSTELLDKNGKDIYEGDIVEYYFHGKFYQDEIIWENFGWVLKNLQTDGTFSSFPLTTGLEYHIIGNILENPEL